MGQTQGQSTTPLYSTFQHDHDMLELVEYFVSELPERVESIQGAIDAGDAKALKRLAHQLKGASAGYGFAVIGEAAAAVEMEAMADEADLNALRERVETLIGLCRRAVARPSAS